MFECVGFVELSVKAQQIELGLLLLDFLGLGIWEW